jgi:hypothetical protein
MDEETESPLEDLEAEDEETYLGDAGKEANYPTHPCASRNEIC